MEKKITIKQEALLPMGFKIFGITLFLVGCGLGYSQFVMMLSNFEFFGILLIIISILLAAGGLLLVTAHYRLAIDIPNKSYQVYVWLLGYHSGKPEPLPGIEKIYINKIKLKQNFHTRSGKVTTHDYGFIYKAFLLLTDGEKIHLDTDPKLEKLEERVRQYQRKLKVLF